MLLVGLEWTIVTRDLRTSICLLNLEECYWAGIRLGLMQSGAAVEASSRRKRGAAAEADVMGGQADAIGEQQLCTDSCPAPDYSW